MSVLTYACKYTSPMPGAHKQCRQLETEVTNCLKLPQYWKLNPLSVRAAHTLNYRTISPSPEIPTSNILFSGVLPK